MRRLALTGAAIAVGVVALIPVGRWEAARHAEEENRAIARVLAAIGALDNGPSGYRRLSIFDCLTYRRGANDYALEVCVDADGRVVEAFDRRRGEPRISSLREDPGRATNRVQRALVDRLLRQMHAPQRPPG